MNAKINKGVKVLKRGAWYTLIKWRGQFVVCFGFDPETDAWSQGHYFPNFQDALELWYKKEAIYRNIET